MGLLVSLGEMVSHAGASRIGGTPDQGARGETYEKVSMLEKS